MDAKQMSVVNSSVLIYQNCQNADPSNNFGYIKKAFQ